MLLSFSYRPTIGLHQMFDGSDLFSRCHVGMQLNSASVILHPTHPEELREISDCRSGSPNRSPGFLASPASDAPGQTSLVEKCAYAQNDDESTGKRASSCLGVYGRECGAVDPFSQMFSLFCRTAQGCQVLLSDRRSSSGYCKGWSTVQKLTQQCMHVS